MNDLNDTLFQSIKDNHVFAIFFSTSNQITLRYQMPCFQMTGLIQCASIKLNSIDENFKKYLNNHFGIDVTFSQTYKQEMLVLFKENTVNVNGNFIYKPSLTSKANEFSYSTILQTFESNKLLIMPRISSLHHFFEICPSWSNNQ